ncbi:MAG: Dihydroneopterin triphosphate 2'-epimerase [Anaerolineales bacterium]|nr:Dihydroneopterin triphosphate 2'-epimerase [Anaerolineales bacterium]
MNTALDQIHVYDLLLRTIIGVKPDEREKRQDVLINLTLYIDARTAGQSDKIKDTVNYKTVTRRVTQHIEKSDYFLVEALAGNIARVILTEFPIEGVRVKVEKPGAVRFTRSVGVEIVRTREDFT